MTHLTYAHYMAVLEGKLPAGLLQQLAQHHLQEMCPACRLAWEENAVAGSPSAPAGPRRPVAEAGGLDLSRPLDEQAVSRADIDRCERALSEAREAAREARTDLSRLLALPPKDWPGRVKNARTRMRSRAFAGLLIEESRRQVRDRPNQAAILARLVPIALDRREGRLDQSWARRLLVRALAHHGNALRVAGNLPAAEACFVELRNHFADVLEDGKSRAEVASLEASLRVDQRRWEIAGSLLRNSVRDYRRAGDTDGQARTLIKRVNLACDEARPHAVLRLLASFDQLDPAVVERYRPSLVAAEAAALCDLGRPGAAREVLMRDGAALTRGGDSKLMASFRTLRGRVALGLGDAEAAVDDFTAARDQLLELDRDYDAILASLDIADALLAAGRTAEAGDLALSLVPMFQSRGVARETLAALRLLAEAARREAVTAQVVARVRNRLSTAAES